MDLKAKACVVTSAHTIEYQRFLPGWAASLAKLNRTPDSVTIALTDHGVESRDILGETFYELFPSSGPIRMGVVWVRTEPPEHLPSLINRAIEAGVPGVDDWVCKLDVDDRATPTWLDGLDDCDGDVLSVGLEWWENGARRHLMPPQPVTGAGVIEAAKQMRNVVWSCSPYRRWIWDHHKVVNRPGEDWQQWIAAAQLGATFTTGPGWYEYHTHGAQLRHQSSDREIWVTLEFM